MLCRTQTAIVNGMKIMDMQYPDVVIALGGGSVIDAAKAVIYSSGTPEKRQSSQTAVYRDPNHQWDGFR